MEGKHRAFMNKKRTQVTLIQESKGTMEMDSMIRKGRGGRSHGLQKYKKINEKTLFKLDS